MSQKPSFTLFSLAALTCLAMVLGLSSTPVRAQSISTDPGNCMNCHEDLYFLHDTGNWFCIRESPMRCVDCHGGDPEAVTQELAHSRRAAHPVINEEVSKCRECHPAECDQRVTIFDQTAGISQVRVAAPYTPADLSASPAVPEPREPGDPFVAWEAIPVLVIASLALIVYVLRRARHHETHEKEQ